jgi:hypothetical protein
MCCSITSHRKKPTLAKSKDDIVVLVESDISE